MPRGDGSRAAPSSRDSTLTLLCRSLFLRVQREGTKPRGSAQRSGTLPAACFRALLRRETLHREPLEVRPERGGSKPLLPILIRGAARVQPCGAMPDGLPPALQPLEPVDLP